jgi:hypothetical protein
MVHLAEHCTFSIKTTKYDHPQLIYGHQAHGTGYLKSMKKGHHLTV